MNNLNFRVLNLRPSDDLDKEKLEKMNPREREKFMEKEAARLRKKRMKKAGGKIRVAM